MTGEEYVSYSDYLALQEERDTALAALSQGGGRTLISKWLEAIKERDEARELAHRFRSLYYTQLGIESSASWFPWESAK